MKNSRFGLFKLKEPLLSFVPLAVVVVVVEVVVFAVVDDVMFALSAASTVLLLLFCGRAVGFVGREIVRISTGNDWTRIAVGRKEKAPKLGAGAERACC